jgi:hypothetical protein
VYISIHGDDSALGSQAKRYANENLDQVSNDELSVNAPQGETQQDKDDRHGRNCRHIVRRRNATTRAQRAHGPPVELRNLQHEFDAVGSPVFNNPVVNLTKAAILM